MSESFAIERKVLLALKEKRALGKLSAKLISNVGFPSFLDYGRVSEEDSTEYMVMTKLGRNLNQLVKEKRKCFSEKSVL